MNGVVEGYSHKSMTPPTPALAFIIFEINVSALKRFILINNKKQWIEMVLQDNYSPRFPVWPLRSTLSTVVKQKVEINLKNNIFTL